MKLSEQFKSGEVAISIELFPPKTEKGETALYRHVERLMQFEPNFITCTYGAGGSTQAKTLEIISQVKSKFNKPVASHLTLVNSTVDQLREYLTTATENNVDYIVALRGDPPQGEEKFTQTQGGLQYANELVTLIREEFNHFGVAVAGYPEKHLEAPSLDVDLDNLKRKVDCGADLIVTQLFYNNEHFYRFRDECEKRNIDVPIVPGILPIVSFSQVQRITGMCGTELPSDLVTRFQECSDEEAEQAVGIDFAIAQTQDLIENGVPGVHFYVLNKSKATCEVLQAIDLVKT